MHNLLKWLTLLAFASVSREECSYSNRKCNCENVDLEDIPYELYSKMPVDETATSVGITGTNYPVIRSFLYPLQKKLNDVQEIKINDCDVVRVDDNAFIAYIKLSELDLRNNKIEDMSFVKYLPNNLTKLVLRNNNIADVGDVFGNLTLLNYIDLSSCKIEKHFDFGLLKDIYYLDLVNISNNNMKTTGSVTIGQNIYCIDISYNVLLEYPNIHYPCFNVSYTSFKGYQFYENETISLDKIVSRGNKKASLQVMNDEGNIEVNSIDLSFAQFDLQQLKELKVKVLKEFIFKYSNVPILSKSIFDFNELLYNDSQEVKLDLSNCNIRDIEKHYFANYILNVLNLSRNNIEKINDDVFYYAQFNELDLSNSNIEYIESLAFNGLSCRSLNLSRNKISCLQFSNISSIEDLDLSFNKLTSIRSHGFGGIKTLRSLNLSNNLLTSVDKLSFEHMEKIADLNLRNNELINVDGLFSHTVEIHSLDISFTDLPLDAFNNSNNKLKTLRITDMDTDVLEENYLSKLHNLEKLYFENSSAQIVDTNSLKGLFSLQYLDTHKLFEQESNLRKHMFKDLKSLVALNLSALYIAVIEPESFEGLASLRELNLSKNCLTKLLLNTFTGLSNLRSLSLNGNSIRTLPLGIFENLTLLESLDLSHNAIQVLEIGIFSGLRKLKYLNLSHNLLQNLRPDILFPLTSLCKLLLDSNQLTTLDYRYVLEDHPVLTFVGISNNKWRCSNLYMMLKNFCKQGVKYQPLANVTKHKTNIEGVYCVEDHPKYTDFFIVHV